MVVDYVKKVAQDHYQNKCHTPRTNDLWD